MTDADHMRLAIQAAWRGLEKGEMPFGACLWANVGRIVYACSIADAAGFGIRQIPITSGRMRQLSQSRIDVAGGLLRDESLERFTAWVGGRAGMQRRKG